MTTKEHPDVMTLSQRASIWESCFTPAPLVLIGSVDDGGVQNFAPKHMATSLGHGPHFGFVCTSTHSTYKNIRRSAEFTVTFPRPSQILQTSLAATPRDQDDSKPALAALPTFAAHEVAGSFVQDGYLFLECRLDRFVEGFGDYCLIAGRVVTAHVHRQSLRSEDRDDQDLIFEAPLLAYLHPGRFTTIDKSFSFPFPLGFER